MDHDALARGFDTEERAGVGGSDRAVAGCHCVVGDDVMDVGVLIGKSRPELPQEESHLV